MEVLKDNDGRAPWWRAPSIMSDEQKDLLMELAELQKPKNQVTDKDCINDESRGKMR